MGISWKQFFKKQYLVLICQKSVFEHNNSKAQSGVISKTEVKKYSKGTLFQKLYSYTKFFSPLDHFPAKTWSLL